MNVYRKIKELYQPEAEKLIVPNPTTSHCKEECVQKKCNTKCPSNTHFVCCQCVCTPTPNGKTSVCECCVAGIRAVLQFLNDEAASDITVVTTAPGNAVVNGKIINFLPNAAKAEIVVFEGPIFVSLCNIEVVQSRSLVTAEGGLPTALKTKLDATKQNVPEDCCCEEELRKLFDTRISSNVKRIDTDKQNIVSGNQNKVLGTGLGVVIVDIPGPNGIAVNLCFVSLVEFV